MILEPAPRAVYCHEPIVAYLFGFGNLVAIHSGFPSPFASCDEVAILIVQRDAIIEQRKVLFAFDGIPLYRSPHRHRVCVFGRVLFVELCFAFAPHPIVGPGQIAYCSIACTVGEEWCFENDLTAVFYMLYGYFRNFTI